jgi:hypothetical protein
MTVCWRLFCGLSASALLFACSNPQAAFVVADSGTGGSGFLTHEETGGGTQVAARDGGSGGSSGTTVVAGNNGVLDPVNTEDAGIESNKPNSDPTYMNLAPLMGTPLDGKGKDLTPPAPAGWTWYDIQGAICRDGSQSGFFVHNGSARKLLIYLEGGGACTDDHFCAFSPANVNQVVAGDGMTVPSTTLGAIAGRQQPGVYTTGAHDGAPSGIFDFANAANPFKDWSQVYIPYCTGDMNFGTRRDGSVANLSGQQFVGYLDMKMFISRIVPTFIDKISRVVLTGASAGGFAAALNFSMVQDSFGSVPVDLIDDSGPLFDDKFIAACMQKRWRDQWGFDGSLPADCTDCRQADGGGLLHMADFLFKKHPNAHVAILSGMQDEVIRLFYSMGLKDCSTYDQADPFGIAVGQLLDPNALFSAQTYTDGLNDLRAKYVSTGRFATYYIGGMNPNYHQHLFRAEFTMDGFGTVTEAQFASDFLNYKMTQVGP